MHYCPMACAASGVKLMVMESSAAQQPSIVMPRMASPDHWLPTVNVPQA
jgi:hypothetical protein